MLNSLQIHLAKTRKIRCMTPYFRTLRAVSATFLRSLLTKFFIFGAIVLLVLYGLVIYLSSAVSSWWLLFLAPLGFITLIAAVLGLGIWWMTTRLLPRKLTRSESQRIAKFTNDVLGTYESLRMPLPMVAALVAKDVFRGKSSRHLENTIEGSKQLSQEFRAIVETMR